MRVANPLGNGVIPPVYTRLVPHVVLVPTNFFDTYYFLRELLRRRLDLKCDPDTTATCCCVEVSISRENKRGLATLGRGPNYYGLSRVLRCHLQPHWAEYGQKAPFFFYFIFFNSCRTAQSNVLGHSVWERNARLHYNRTTEIQDTFANLTTTKALCPFLFSILRR